MTTYRWNEAGQAWEEEVPDEPDADQAGADATTEAPPDPARRPR
jgi:hypothetical protein